MTGDAARARRRLERQPEGRWPIVMPHAHIRRMIDRSATLLVLTRKVTLSRVKPNIHEVHDALIIRKNRERSRNERPDLQESSLVLTIEILSVETKKLAELDLLAARAAGFRTTDELREDWVVRHRTEIDLELEVHLATFTAITGRYLHKKVHRGYTTDPTHAAEGEPQALSAGELEEMSEVARDRYRLLHAEEIAKREARSLANQLREAQNRAVLRGIDVTPEVAAIRKQLDQIRSKVDKAA